MSDLNECHFTGLVEQFYIIQTKTGTPMVKAFVLCGKERLTVIAFKELADATRLNEGERVAVSGAIQSTSWESKDGVKRYGFQVIASEISKTETGQAIEPAPAPSAPTKGIPNYSQGPF